MAIDRRALPGREVQAQKRVHVWDAPVRLLHWIHVGALAALAVTGIYIGGPFLDAGTVGSYTMGWVRVIHFSAAFVFVLAFLIRAYWFFRGNAYEDWHAWVPIGRRRLRALGRMIKYYLFLIRERPRYLGVNPLSGLTYLGLGVMIALQALTGLALFSLPFMSGLWPAAFGWLNLWLGSQVVRLIHHMLMWLFFAFFIVHIYMAVLDDIEERNADMASIITGDKFEPIAEQTAEHLEAG